MPRNGMEHRLQPILKYPGAKWLLAPWIVAQFPPHRVYLEPYFGSGAVLFAKPPAPIELVNDLDSQVVNLFRVIRERPAELAQALALTPWAREEFTRANAEPETTDDVERARLFLVQ
ncbi:MAG TPA: DNA adenine methylase, partial [Thermomicrobiales bacterium]|nr:DNA adenine methylase [Thermomicrobiales bacterium]